MARTETATVGLLAGWGRFPIYFAERAREAGLRVYGLGLAHMADPVLRSLCTAGYDTIGLGQMGRAIRLFHRASVVDWVMAGKVQKTALMSPWAILSLWPDWRTIRFWYSRSRRDNRDDSLLLGIIAEFEREGMRCGSALDLCPELLVKQGQLTRRAPNHAEEQDIRFGWDLAKEMGRLDIGQSIAVRNRAVLAVEAIEGTDRAIARAGELCRHAPFVVVKVAKPQQDRRFDVPTVGVSTIETMHASGGRVLAVEAGQTILLDEPETVALADRYGIAIVAI